MAETEVAVIGGGLVGMAIAYGLQRRGRRVTVFDEGDDAFRASRGNFGLVWVQGKGANLPDYARWTRLSARLWPELRDELLSESSTSIELAQPGGLDLFLSDDDAETGMARLERLRSVLDGDYPFEFLGHNQVKSLVPEIGPDVVGAAFGPEDGHVNPLYLLRALHGAFTSAGGRTINGAAVERIEPLGTGFRIERSRQTETGPTAAWRAERVVLCAGLGNAALAPMVGMIAPIAPQRGQVLVTERLQPFLKHPTLSVRQVGEGAVQLGESHEDVGLDSGTTPAAIGHIARRASRFFPLLERVRIVRCWGALRVLTSDGHPLYQQSESCPGASLVTCHSGVTLAAAHALVLAGWIDGAEAPPYMESFSAKRFAGSQAA